MDAVLVPKRVPSTKPLLRPKTAGQESPWEGRYHACLSHAHVLRRLCHTAPLVSAWPGRNRGRVPAPAAPSFAQSPLAGQEGEGRHHACSSHDVCTAPRRRCASPAAAALPAAPARRCAPPAPAWCSAAPVGCVAPPRLSRPWHTVIVPPHPHTHTAPPGSVESARRLKLAGAPVALSWTCRRSTRVACALQPPAGGHSADLQTLITTATFTHALRSPARGGSACLATTAAQPHRCMGERVALL